MKKDIKVMLAAIIIGLIPMIVAALMYERLPEMMPIHWGVNGMPDRYAQKSIACVALPAILLTVNCFLFIFLDNDPKKYNFSKGMRRFAILIIPVVSNVCTALTITAGLGTKVDVEIVISMLVGLIFIVIGMYLPECKQNYTIGIKCPWTLNSEENWNRTHKLGGHIFVLAGVIILIGGFVGVLELATGIAIALIVVVPFMYSFLLYKKGI